MSYYSLMDKMDAFVETDTWLWIQGSLIVTATILLFVAWINDNRGGPET